MGKPTESDKNTLTVTDNRTGNVFTVPYVFPVR